MIVAPSVGVFRVPVADRVVVAGDLVDEGQVVGVVEGPGAVVPVRSPFRGRLMGMLAEGGQRLREGEPVAWLSVA